MKKLFLLLLIITAITTQAQQKQSLKDLLYSGKLKKDSSGVIRSTDDLSTKIDTSTKKEPVIEKVKTVTLVGSVKKSSIDVNESTVVVPATTDSVINTTTVITSAAPAKTNTRIWKEYADSLTKVLKEEILKAKQIKKDTYFMSFDYEIGTDGKVSVINVGSTPANAYLQAQVKQILDDSPPNLSPGLDSNGQPRKVKRKQGFTITKD
jgi:hypothetical protein